MNEQKQNLSVFIILILLFTVHTYTVYTSGTENINPTRMNTSAIKGKALWQKNNCTSCHQIYGLGGYLGPDLTNVYSRYGDGVKSFLNAGIESMPVYSFSDQEQQDLLEFFKSLNESGFYPNKDVEKTWYGNIKIRDKTR